ncbi:hypothetical protein E4P43_19075 [Blastococcus sp. TF02A-35]|nr:hypothetical protein E4P43_19075 [Blastococcus sp. TF02A_35]
MSASRRPGAPRRYRLSGRRNAAGPDRVDTTPLGVPRPHTRPMPTAAAQPPGDDRPTAAIPAPATRRRRRSSSRTARGR